MSQLWIRTLKTLRLHNQARVIRDKKLKPERIKFYSHFIQEGNICFDVGANIGSRTDIFLQLGAKVISVEPQPEVFSYLNKRFHSDNNFVGVNKALGDTEGFAEMFLCDSDGVSTMSKEWIDKIKTAGRVDDSFNWDKKITVPVTTLDNLITLYGCT